MFEYTVAFELEKYVEMIHKYIATLRLPVSTYKYELQFEKIQFDIKNFGLTDTGNKIELLYYFKFRRYLELQ